MDPQENPYSSLQESNLSPGRYHQSLSMIRFFTTDPCRVSAIFLSGFNAFSLENFFERFDPLSGFTLSFLK